MAKKEIDVFARDDFRRSLDCFESYYTGLLLELNPKLTSYLTSTDDQVPWERNPEAKKIHAAILSSFPLEESKSTVIIELVGIRPGVEDDLVNPDELDEEDETAQYFISSQDEDEEGVDDDYSFLDKPTVVEKDEEVDLVPLISSDHWKVMCESIHSLNMNSTDAGMVSMARSSVEKCIRAVCGKVESKENVHNILIKSAKLHSLSVFGQKFFVAAHTYFCSSFEDTVEFDLAFKQSKSNKN
jgi:hypothetical protein